MSHGTPRAWRKRRFIRRRVARALSAGFKRVRSVRISCVSAAGGAKAAGSARLWTIKVRDRAV